MTTKKQPMSWDGSRNVFLWIIKTVTGNKRTWKATEAEARAAAEARGWSAKERKRMTSKHETESGGGIGSSVLLAEQIATRAHANQFRRDGVTPYITHPAAVAKRLGGESEAVIAAAWLHDVLEDTCLTATTLLDSGIPKQVVDAVARLTKTSGHSYDFYLEGVRENEIARKVKVADMLHNLSDSPTKNQILKYARGLLALLS